MNYISFLAPSGAPTFGVVRHGQVMDMGARGVAESLRAWIAAGFAMPGPFAADHRLDDLELLPVIPDPGKIICVGLNYSDHVKETGRTDSEHPSIFFRTAASQTAHARPVRKPAATERFDFEGELAIIIGKPGRNIGRAEALGHVAGYACYNDITARDWQRHTSQWGPGKNFDGTGAFGPWMVGADALPPRGETRLTTRLNGEVVQQATLDQMIFSIEDLIAYTSVFTRLMPGDVIVSGTPGGVGDRRSPPLYMQPGDTVEVEIDGVGLLRNAIVATD